MPWVSLPGTNPSKVCSKTRRNHYSSNHTAPSFITGAVDGGVGEGRGGMGEGGEGGSGKGEHVGEVVGGGKGDG